MKKLIFLFFIYTTPLHLGLAAPFFSETINLSNNEGGYVTGKDFSSSEFSGKITALFYVDPDHRSINDEANQKLQQENFNLKYYQSFAIINMAATWLPNAILEAALKSSQKKFPSTHYVKDFKKSFVKKGNLTDDSYQTLLLNENGELLFNHTGYLSSEKTQELIKIITNEINRLDKGNTSVKK